MIQDTRLQKSKVFEKVVRKNGKLFLVRFVIVESAGKLRGKIISCEAIEALKGSVSPLQQNFLPFSLGKSSVPASRIPREKIVSPFSSLEFFMSQMTRAPSRSS